MTEGKSLLNKQQRKKANRKKRKQAERAAHRNLDDVTGVAIAQALALAPQVVDAPSHRDAHRGIDVALASVSEAEFVRKRVNDALAVAEWLTEVRVWLWRDDEDGGKPLSDAGANAGIELRISRAT